MLNAFVGVLGSCILVVSTVNALANSSSASFNVRGVVPVIVQTNVERSTALIYQVREVSNNQDGYTIEIETDAKSVKYNGAQVKIVDGQAILTEVMSQDRSINAVKKLVFSSPPGFLKISVRVM